ncbi:MAG: hypothetical protein ACTSQE_11025 [Candidatus Heimdallarchaeaceae archaeon]
MLWQNKIPVSAIVYELIVVIALALMSFFVFRRYFERKKKPVLYLGLGYLFYALGALSSCTGRWLGFFSSVPYTQFSYTDFTTLLGYILMAVGNVFIVAFIDSIFIQKGVDFVIYFAVLNGVTIGLIVPNLAFEWGLVRAKVGIAAYHLILSISIFLILAVLSFREVKLNTKKIAKIGFGLIGAYAIQMILLFASFGADSILINTDLYSLGYSPAYYFGWSFVVLGTIVGYLGLIMPKWFVKMIKVSD